VNDRRRRGRKRTELPGWFAGSSPCLRLCSRAMVSRGVVDRIEHDRIAVGRHVGSAPRVNHPESGSLTSSDAAEGKIH